MASVAKMLNAMSLGQADQVVLSKIITGLSTIEVPLAEVFETDATNITPITNATGPKRDSANGDTDSGIVITWIASNSDAIIFQVGLPSFIDAGDKITVKMRIVAGGSTDTPTIAADMYINEGDTKVEATSAAVSDAIQELSVSISGSNVPGNARTFTCELTPGAHTTDALTLSALWVELS